MRTEEMRNLLDEYDAAQARHDATAAAAVFGEKAVYEDTPLGLRSEGREAIRLLHWGRYQMTPDIQNAYHAELVGSDVLVKRAIVSGHMKEKFLGVPACGYIEFPCLFVVRFADGAISQMIVYWDLEDLCQQLKISIDEVRMNVTALQALLAEGNAHSRASIR